MENKLKTVLDGMLGSYARRDARTSFEEWLAERLRLEMPELSEDASKKLAGDIVAAVADYDSALNDLNRAIEDGESKEGWLAERLADECADMPPAAVGEKLQLTETNLAALNMQLMGTAGTVQVDGMGISDTEPVEWNKYSIKDRAHKIGEQAALMGVAASAVAVKGIPPSCEEGEIGTVLKSAYQDNRKDEVKAVVAGAVRIAAEKKLAALSPDMPTEVICGMAGVAVEGAAALCDAADEKIGTIEAVDRIGRAGVAAGCQIGVYYLRGALSGISVFGIPCGALLVDSLGGLLDHLESPRFINNAYGLIRDAAVAAWEGIWKSNAGQVLIRLGKKVIG